MTEQELIQDRARAFVGGVEAAAHALRAVLKRKVAVGIITDVAAQSIFEGVGNEIDRALDMLKEDR